MRRVKKSFSEIKLFINKANKNWKKSKASIIVRRFFKKVKKGYRQLKYIDKTKANYFIVTSFLGLFCTFTMVTYSAFTFSKTLNAAVITIGKLKYTLSSESNKFSNGVVSLDAGETLVLDLSLSSLNSFESKYALKYSTESENVEVFYSHDVGNNTSGVIGASGSNIGMKLVLVNSGEASATVNLNVLGGYTHNNLEASNITIGYYEADIVTRIHQLNSNLGNDTRVSEFPESTSGYGYLRSVCNNPANPVFDKENWKLNLNAMTSQIACDVYFKEMTDDLEIYYLLQETGATKISDGQIANEVPASGYTFREASCISGTPSWDSVNNKLSVSGFDGGNICVAYFNKTS